MTKKAFLDTQGIPAAREFSECQSNYDNVRAQCNVQQRTISDQVFQDLSSEFSRSLDILVGNVCYKQELASYFGFKHDMV